MTQRHHDVRIAVLIAVALLLVACQWNGAGKSVASEARRGPIQATTPVAERSTASPAAFTDADFAKHVATLKLEIKKKFESSSPRTPAAEFSFVIQPPFVVIGDEPGQAVQEHAEGTVKWAVDRLKQDFFSNDPKEILDIWLFKDKASYEKHARLLFGDEPTTPYGYYSSTHKALIMNIETGGGTLVHEIVHPFMEANFPDCPPWLNEGLGSLYEQCGDANGHIRLYQLASAGITASYPRETGAVIQGPDGDGLQRFLNEDRVSTTLKRATSVSTCSKGSAGKVL